MKFIYTTDWHLKSLPSENVIIESFADILLKRIEQMLSEDVDFIIHGGDFFDAYGIEDMNLFNRLVKLFKDQGIEFYVLPGSHDLIGYSPQSLGWTALRTLENAKLLTILQPETASIHGLEVAIRYPNKSHTVDMYQGLKNKIVLSHNIISPITVPFPHILTKDIAAVVDQCLFLCSDLHMPFTEFYDTCAFLNPGPLLKSSLSDKAVEAGYFKIFFDPSAFVFQFKKILFPDATITEVDRKTTYIREFTEKIVIHQDTFSIDDLVTRVSDGLFHDPIVTQEALRWIHSKESTVCGPKS